MGLNRVACEKTIPTYFQHNFLKRNLRLLCAIQLKFLSKQQKNISFFLRKQGQMRNKILRACKFCLLLSLHSAMCKIVSKDQKIKNLPTCLQSDYIILTFFFVCFHYNYKTNISVINIVIIGFATERKILKDYFLYIELLKEKLPQIQYTINYFVLRNNYFVSYLFIKYISC